VLTNGGGVGALSADQLVALGGSLADLSSATVARLDSRLPVGWSRTNPVDLLTDIDAERYADTLGAAGRCRQRCVAGSQRATVLSSSVESAQALIDAGRRGRRRASRCWRCGWATTRLPPACSTPPASPTIRTNRTRWTASCIWSATTRRRWH
jgi:hypothetical protein